MGTKKNRSKGDKATKARQQKGSRKRSRRYSSAGAGPSCIIQKSVCGLSQIQAARRTLADLLPSTPLVYNAWLSQLLEASVFLKLENMQPIGSFKIRGATYKISTLSQVQRKKGVICASAGNHAQGVAWAAQILGAKATIVMPVTAPLMKVENSRTLGAEVILHGESYDDAFAEAKRLCRARGLTFVHAFEDAQVTAGQGTIALELFEQLPDFDVVIGPIGGGGLMGGIGLAVKALRPQVEVVACQASGAASMLESVKRKRPVELEKVATLADGIAVKHASQDMLNLLTEVIDRWVEIEDDEIVAAILMLAEKAKIITEGAGASALATALRIKPHLKGKKVVLLACGGNIDINLLSRVIDRALIQAGRLLRLSVLVSDKPGALHQLTAVIADAGANILQVIHDRDQPTVRIDQTRIELTLETRGQEHSLEIIKEIEKIVLTVEVHRVTG